MAYQKYSCNHFAAKTTPQLNIITILSIINISRALQNQITDSEHPICPETGYVSKYPASFRGCYGCRDNTPYSQFKKCAKWGDRNIIALFHKEYKIHSALWCKQNQPPLTLTQLVDNMNLSTVTHTNFDINQNKTIMDNNATQSPPMKHVTFTKPINDDNNPVPLIGGVGRGLYGGLVGL